MQGTTLQRWTLGVIGTAVAAGLLAAAVSTHRARACVERDTPYLPICPEPSKAQEAIRAEMRDRIARNPGDSVAWTRLLVNETEAQVPGVLRGAAVVAPYNHNVARWRAVQALRARNTQEGVDLLVGIVRNRPSPDSAGLLARLASTTEGMALLRPHVVEGQPWVPQVISAAAAMKMPPGAVMPLVAEAAKNHALPEDTRRGYMRALKTSGNWLDAYGLWLAQHKQPMPLLYNGSFDQPFESDGFDWEYTPAPRSRTGVVISQMPFARRGQVLDLEFTGRTFTAPIVRQYVFAPPGKYQLRGEYMASKLRSESGLAWSVLCTSGRKAVLARSKPLPDTGGLWKTVELDFTLPPDCGVVASVQLETAAEYEARTGIKGHVAFDNFTLSNSVSAQ